MQAGVAGQGRHLSGADAGASAVIIPCIDLMGGKVVQLVQGRDKALERDNPLAMLTAFDVFPEVQVIISTRLSALRQRRPCCGAGRPSESPRRGWRALRTTST